MRVTFKEIYHIKHRRIFSKLRTRFYFTKTTQDGTIKRFYRAKKCGQRLLGNLYITSIDHDLKEVVLKDENTGDELTIKPGDSFYSGGTT